MKDFMGFEITVTHFVNPVDYVVAGIWYWDNGEKKSFTIFINPLAPDTNITIAHECVHALQDLDIDFQQELQNYPIPLQLRIADRVAEMSAIQIFMPREKVACDRLAGLSVYDIALKYGVSKAIVAN
jgi:Zn-dependent peptidase ImmA (M78 family)